MSKNKNKKNIVFVGKKYYKDKTHGPAAIMFSLEEAFRELDVNYEDITLSENCGKIRFLCKLFQIIFFREKIINVHINGFVSAAIVCLISKINKKCDYFLTVHGVYKEQIKYYNAGRLKKFYCYLERIVYNSFPNLICVSELCKKKILELYNPKGNIYVIENAVGFKDYKLQDKETIGKEFLFLGGTKPVKGIEKTLNVFNKLVEMDNEVHLNIYGQTSQEELALLNEKINKMGRSESIRYKGYVDKQELISILNNNDFHIAFSKFDTFNVAIIEAMNYGCINITNRNSGAASLINNGENGFIIDNDMDDLTVAKQIYNIIQGITIEKYNEICNRAHERIRNYSWNNVAQKYLKLFEGGKNEGISY